MEASRDGNRVTSLLAVSSADGVTPVTLYADPTTHRLLTSVSGGAPTDATYVTLTTTSGLSAERVLTGTANQITITDNGAGSTVVLSLPQAIATASTPTFASLTLTAATSLTLGTASSLAGSVVLKNAANANTLTVKSGVVSASYTLTMPTAVGAAGTVLTDAAGDGVLSWAAPAGSGTVTTVSVTTANGVSGTVANATTTPAITLTLGVITPTSVNGLTLAAQAVGFTIAGGTTSKTLTVPLDASVSGTNTGDQTLPVVATGAEVNTGTDNAKFVSPKAVADSKLVSGPASITDGHIAAWDANAKTLKDGGVLGTAASSAVGAFATSTQGGKADTAVQPSTSPLLTTVELGHASDTTLARVSAGVVSVEGVTLAFGNDARFPTTAEHTSLTAIEALGNGVMAKTGTGTYSASATLGPALGGTGVANNAASTLTISGNYATTLTVTGATGVTLPTTGTLATLAGAETLSNKRITERTGTTTSSATPTINTDNVSFYSLTAQAEDITSFTTNLSGTPTERQTLWIAITGTAARAITWGTSFEASTVALPTTTVTTARLDVGFVWNTVTSKWRCVASA